MADPNRYGRNWSRTFEHPVDKPRAGVPLLHGLTDSPYSVQTLAGILHRHGAWVVGLRIPGHGTAPAGLTKIKWQDYAAAVRIGAKHVAEATKQLGNAASLQPDNSRYSYVHALALQKIGNTKSAMATLVAAHERDPGNRDILFALATMSRDRGDLEKAVHYANALVELSPADPGPRQLLESLQSQQR
jgi:predicted Zn-dependent protease